MEADRETEDGIPIIGRTRKADAEGNEGYIGQSLDTYGKAQVGRLVMAAFLGGIVLVVLGLLYGLRLVGMDWLSWF